MVVAIARLNEGLRQRELLPVYLAFHAGLAAVLFARRNPPVRRATRLQEAIAWASAMLPAAVRFDGDYQRLGEALALIGLAIAILALYRLDRAFGVAPADRGLVQEGIYRVIRHPMYLGELLTLVGAVMSCPTPWNGGVLGLQLILTWLRIDWEERIVAGYEQYRQRVRWRLVPFVW